MADDDGLSGKSGRVPEQGACRLTPPGVLNLLTDCGRRLWRLQLGDPDPLGLALTAGYAVVLGLMLALLIWPRPGRFAGPRDRQLWTLALVLFAVLAVNKQLDLQHYAMNIGRCTSTAQGWYANRAGLEHGVALALLGLSLGAAVALAVWFRPVLAANRRLILGMALLAAYVLLQMTDVLHLDQHLRPLVASIALHRTIEALALAVLAWAAWTKCAGA